MLPTPRRDKVASEKWAHNGVQARGEEAAEPWLGWGEPELAGKSGSLHGRDGDVGSRANRVDTDFKQAA